MHRVFLRAPIIEKPFLRLHVEISPPLFRSLHLAAPTAITQPEEPLNLLCRKPFLCISHVNTSLALRLSAKINIPNEPHAACTENFLIKKAAGAVWWKRERKLVGAARGWFALSLSAHFNFPRRGLLLKLSHLRDQHVQLAFSLVLVFLKQQK